MFDFYFACWKIFANFKKIQTFPVCKKEHMNFHKKKHSIKLPKKKNFLTHLFITLTEKES
jgi:hypothetical protein